MGRRPLRPTILNILQGVFVGGRSTRTLTLKGLERDGLVWRTVHPTIPPRVEYGLTELGLSLAHPVRALGEWARAHTDELDAARARYEALSGD